MQQFLDSTPLVKAKVIVDFRETTQFDALLTSFGADVERRTLEVGDFLCSVRLVIERKTRSDFEASIIDGRLFTQLQHLHANYERVVIIVEGTTNDDRISRNALLGSYASVLADYGASIFFTRDIESTAELVFNFAKHEQLAKKTPLRIYAKRKALNQSQSVRAVIESLPSIGPKIAKSLLIHFGTIERLSSANEREIAEVDGIGKKRAKLIRSVFIYHYLPEEDQMR